MWRRFAKLDNHARTPFAVVDFHHILESLRLEGEPVGRFAVRRDRLGVRVDHHNFIAALPQGKRRMTTTPVKLNALHSTVSQHPPKRLNLRKFTLEPRVIGRFVMISERSFLRTHRLQVGLLERAPNRHHLSDSLHLRAQLGRAARELLEGKTRNLHDDIVKRRLKAGQRLACDVVPDLVKRIADGEKRGDLCNREARCLRGKRGRARNARIHLDDDAPPRLRINRPLHVRATRCDSDLAQHGNRIVTHRLILAVGQRLNRRDGDRVARMNAHWVHVLDGADDDGVPRLVKPHHEIQGRLPSQGRRHRVRTFAANDFVKRINGQRLDVRTP